MTDQQNHEMMRITLLFVFILTITSTGWSQSPLQITQTTVSGAVTAGDAAATNEIELSTTIRNVSDRTIALKWTKYELDLPLSWEAEVYDKELCYLPNALTNYDPGYYEAPIELIPGESFDLTLHIYTNGASGLGAVEFPLSLVEDPSEVLATITFYPQFIEKKPLNTATLKVFPNPTDDFFQVNADERITQLVLYNSIGQPVRHFDANPGQRYDISDLPEGLYLLGLVDQKGETQKTFRLMKRVRRA